ncbi:PA3496 family putative envelope integrity protein [Legionella jamestowniensis]|uniref:Uncharacterized protein n=1 Tax=Legionella jamestowniensis TaxID=455 RepID=A0A0W0UZP1_9GAMM|nr:hypothetical protein [Legionella jamestowniensis]KTD13319.1 hypothetical protein Ljam_0109 [Legionella jamestowniensis]OCH98346.1 hypothetical protein A8135_12385 [Legionella jamestowniensis]SFL77134.1 hypothetical protein SAMN02746073_1819 [Legionella jamestowniensis DSM 19215]
MSDMFDDDLDDEVDPFINPEEELINTDTLVDSTLDARRRLENMLEEKRLRDELDDFVDY